MKRPRRREARGKSIYYFPESPVLPIFLVLSFSLLVLALGRYLVINLINCRNTDFLSEGSGKGCFRNLRIAIYAGSSLRGFKVTEDEVQIAEYFEAWTFSLTPELVHRFKFREGSHQFRLLPGSFGFVMGDGAGRSFTYRLQGWTGSKQVIEGWDLRIEQPDSRSADLEIYRGEEKISHISFAPSMGLFRDRKVSILTEVEASLEVFLCLVAVFSRPRFGHVTCD